MKQHAVQLTKTFKCPPARNRFEGICRPHLPGCIKSTLEPSLARPPLVSQFPGTLLWACRVLIIQTQKWPAIE